MPTKRQFKAILTIKIKFKLSTKRQRKMTQIKRGPNNKFVIKRVNKNKQ